MLRRKTTIFVISIIMAGLAQLTGCVSPSSDIIEVNFDEDEINENPGEEKAGALVYKESAKLKYAKEFSIDYYEDGFIALNTVSDGRKYLLIPEGKEIPEGLDEEYVIIKCPVENIYLVSSATMDMIVELGALDTIRFSGIKSENWYVEEAKEAMKEGSIIYAGKYNKPDYETLLSKDCSLVIENTMINHSPEVLDQFNQFDIPYIVDYSSYENHPLGRVEWVKFYGALLGCEEKAEEILNKQEAIVEEAEKDENTGKTVAYFYITSNNLVQVKKSSDYIPKMIEIAGGKYIFDNLYDDSTKKTTINMQVEEFYNGAKDADIIIYNSSIDGGIESVDDLIKKCSFLADFKAVKEGNVWCTTNDSFQQSLSVGYMIEDMNKIFNGEEDDLHYMFKID